MKLRLKLYCVTHEIAVQDFVTEAIEEKLGRKSRPEGNGIVTEVPNVADKFEDYIPRLLDPMSPLTLGAAGPMPPTKLNDPDLKGITLFLASTATPERGGLPYLDAVLPAEHRLAAARVVRDLGALPPGLESVGNDGSGSELPS